MKLIDEIKRHEGFKSRPYKCTEGYLTIGWGFAIKDLVIEEDIADLILMRKIQKLLERLIIAFPWFEKSPDEVKSVVTNICYQMDINGFKKFKKTINLIEAEKYEEASVEMLDSKWAKKQTPRRAKELSERLACVKKKSC